MKRSNFMMAAYITSYARLKLIDMLLKLDSI